MKIEIDEKFKKAYVEFDSFYVPTLEGRKNVLRMEHPAELLSKLSKASSLEKLVVQSSVYSASDSDLKEIKHDMKTLFYNSYMHYDEALHTGKLGVIQNIPYAAFFGSIPFINIMRVIYNTKIESKTMGFMSATLFAPLLFILALNYLGKTFKTSKVLRVAKKFKEESLEIADRLEVKQGTNIKLSEKVSQLEQYFDSVDGSTPEIYLKMADKAAQLDMPRIKELYLKLFNQNKATERMGERFKRKIYKFFAELFFDKETKAIKVEKKDLLQPLIKKRAYKIELDFLGLPAKDSLELYFLKKVNVLGRGQMAISIIPKSDETNSLAHLVMEKDVKVNARLFTPNELSDEQIEKIKESINNNIYQTEYYQQKLPVRTLVATLNKNKRLGYIFLVWGVVMGSPILAGFGLLDLIFGRVIRERQADHAKEIADGYDHLYKIKDITQIEDKGLKILSDIVESASPYEAYTKATHYALQHGLNDIAKLYQEKALFYQRKFKEPSKPIMCIKNK